MAKSGGGLGTWRPNLKHNLRRSYRNAHAYHINSISLNSDSETFLSADDLRINLFHFDHPEPLNIVVSLSLPPVALRVFSIHKGCRG